jgi:hypothetical protein
MAGPSFRPEEYERLPKWQKGIYWICIVGVVAAIGYLLFAI